MANDAETDRQKIIAVLTRYATGIDTRDWALFRTCFTEDFSADYGAFGAWQGPDEITHFMTESHARMGPTLHILSNFVLEIEADTASGRTYVAAVLAAGATGVTHRAAGYYDDILARTPRGWKIQYRKFTAVNFE